MPLDNPFQNLPSGSGLDSNSTVAGPLTETLREIGTVIWNNAGQHIPRDLHWDIIALTLTISTLIWFKRKGNGAKGADGKARNSGLFSYLFPKDIYTHPSARVDLWLWITERALQPLFTIGLLLTIGPSTENTVIALLEFLFGPTPALAPSYVWMLLYSLFTLLCYDFVFYLTHYTMHKVPALWAIHKVHHSAEVLTPLTRSREHFLAVPIWAAGGAFSYGFAAGIFAYLFNGNIVAATLFNIGFFSLLFGFNGSFRHFHVQFHYPAWLSKWLHSPVMHHVHHSYLKKHWDTNFAAVTSIWDRLFGTLYIPEKDEYTPWGIPPAKQFENRTYWQNTIGPFRDWYRMLSGNYSKSAEINSPKNEVEP